jgi:hypothetical protein
LGELGYFPYIMVGGAVIGFIVTIRSLMYLIFVIMCAIGTAEEPPAIQGDVLELHPLVFPGAMKEASERLVTMLLPDHTDNSLSSWMEQDMWTGPSWLNATVNLTENVTA